MAMSIVRQLKVSTDQTALIVAFLPSTGSTESSGCRIDSQKPEGLGGIVGAEYSLSVQLDQSSQSVVIHETVSGLNARNTVEGTFRIPIGLLEKPKFHNAADRGNTRIKIAFALREGKFLRNKHFKWHTKGTWSNMTARALQMWKYEEWTSNTRTVEIMLLNAPKNAYEMKGDIERALGLPVNKAPLPHSVSLSANARSAQSLFGTIQQNPRAGIASIPVCPSPAIRDKKTENTLHMQKARMLENAELARKRNEEEARLKVERDAAIQRSLLSLPVLPCTGTSIFPFMPTLEKETPTSVLTNAYQSITFMHPYVRHSFEELRLEDYNSGHTIGDLGVAYSIQTILAEKMRWQEQAAKSEKEAAKSEKEAAKSEKEAAKSDKEASDLRTELFACNAGYLSKQAQFTQENAVLRAQNRSLLTDLTVQKGNLEVETRSNAEETTKLQAENEDLKQRLHTATTTSNMATTEHSSVDLLGLDFSNDTGAHIVPVVGDHTTNQPQLDWLNDTFPSTAIMSGLAENKAENTTTAAFQKATCITPTNPTGTAPTPRVNKPSSVRPQTPDPDMILRIDDAVDAVSEEARKALKAGKGVTVQITEPEAIADWLEQVNRRIVIDSMGVVRTTE